MAVTTYGSNTFPEEGVRTVQIAFKDEDGTAVIPNSATWTLTDRPSDPTATPTVINELEDEVISPAATVNIVLEGDDLAFLTAEEGALCHRALVVSYQYDSDIGSNLDDKIQFFFTIERIIGV